MNKKLVAIVVIGLLVVGAGSYYFLTQQKGEAGAITLHGNVDIREVELAFRQPGRIAKLYFDEGAAVKQGQLLAELDAKPYEDALAVAKANRALAEADLDKARHGSRGQEIAQADATVRQATAALAEAAASVRARRQVRVETIAAALPTGAKSPAISPFGSFAVIRMCLARRM